MENVFANRLQSARKMAGLSLQGLADRLDNLVSKQSLNKYEQGIMKPDSEVLIALANSLNVSIDFFFTVPTVNVEFESIDFRKYSSKLSKTEEASVIEKAKDCFERYFELEDILQLNEKSDYFTFDKIIKTAEEAEEAARKLREDWNLGYDPIPDVVEMLEDKGYKVIDLLVNDAFDGMKANVGNKKIIVLKKSVNDADDVVRKRFTALHELAHHGLTFSTELKHSEEEKLCHVFACAVLYPEEMAKKELHKERFHFYQKELEIIKERWGISFTAIFHRAHRLGILNDFILRKFHVGYKKRGYHLPNSEPGRYRSKEAPTRMERLVYLGLAKEVLTINEAVYFSGITAWELRGKMKLLV
jgi:Zn-dependent peptidase ImmA (M78 family)/DNA-binding XRE family transcriptional regulator